MWQLHKKNNNKTMLYSLNGFLLSRQLAALDAEGKSIMIPCFKVLQGSCKCPTAHISLVSNDLVESADIAERGSYCGLWASGT